MGLLFFFCSQAMARRLFVFLTLVVCVLCQTSPTNTPIGPGEFTQTPSPNPVVSIVASPTRSSVFDSASPSGSRQPNPSISESPAPSASESVVPSESGIPPSPSAPPSTSVTPSTSGSPGVSIIPPSQSVTPGLSPSNRKSPDPTPTNSPVFYYERPTFVQPDDSSAALFEVVLDGSTLYTERPGRPLCSGEQFAAEAADFLSLSRATDVRIISIFDCEITVLVCDNNVDDLLNYITFEAVDAEQYPSFVNAFVETNVNWDVTCDSYSQILYYYQYGFSGSASSSAAALTVILGLNLILAFLF